MTWTRQEWREEGSLQYVWTQIQQHITAAPLLEGGGYSIPTDQSLHLQGEWRNLYTNTITAAPSSEIERGGKINTQHV